MNQRNTRKLKTFQMRCLSGILGFKFTLLDKKGNEDICILRMTGPPPIENELRK